EDGIRDFHVTGVQTCALPIFQKWQSFLGPIVFPDGFHSTELQYSLTPRFCGRQPGANIFGSLESEMFFDFRLQAIFVVLNLRPEIGRARVGKECRAWVWV